MHGPGPFVIVWLLVFSGPYGQTVHPIHFKTLYSCMGMAAQYAKEESQCVSVSRPVILPTRDPLQVPMADA